MTIEEMLAREAIRHTMACYNMAGDRVREDEFIAAFTEDGILESEGVPEADAFRYEGRQALRAWMARWRQPSGAQTGPRATFVRHHLSTCLIELTGPSTAKARTYWTAYTDIGPDHGGVYLDAFRKVDESWLIAHRRVRLDWRVPGSLFVSAITRVGAR